MTAPLTHAGTAGGSQHRLLFYDHDDELGVLLADFVTDGLDGDEVVVMIVTPEHWAGIETVLTARGVGVRGALESGRLVVLDAGETLAAISVDGAPDEAAFDRIIARLIEDLAAEAPSLRAFGEMVALLWDAGRLGEAIALESLWCRLGERLPFELLCAYPSTAFLPSGAVAALNQVCDLHSSIRPSGSDGAEPIWFRVYSAAPQSVTRARRDLLALLGPDGDPEANDAALLIVTELAANAVRHARTQFVLEVTRRNELLRIVVRDGDESPLHPITPVPDPESGRGLNLVAALSRQWGHVRTATGKLAWAEIPTA